MKPSRRKRREARERELRAFYGDGWSASARLWRELARRPGNKERVAMLESARTMKLWDDAARVSP